MEKTQIPNRAYTGPDPYLCSDDINIDKPSESNVIKPIPLSTALAKYSLIGRSAMLADLAIKAKPLLGNLCMQGEATVWYAPPNSGKTLLAISLLLEAIFQQRIDAANVYYVNVDDSSTGIAAKSRTFDDIGVHMLVQGHRGFANRDLIPSLDAMAKDGTAASTFIIIDTMKKFADLMSKKESSAFSASVRAFVVAGGTVLGLAHTNKHRSAKDKLVYAGTSDIVDDFDCAYVLDADPERDADKFRYVIFKNFKLRGGGVEEATYRYSVEEGLDYHSRVASVSAVDNFDRVALDTSDSVAEKAVIIRAIKHCIEHGVNVKTYIMNDASLSAKASRRAVQSVLERHTGDDPKQHLWNYTVRDRGAQVFALLSSPEPAAFEGNHPTAPVCQLAATPPQATGEAPDAAGGGSSQARRPV